MIRDLSDAEDGVVVDCDLCLIGAGAAGIAIARALAGSKQRVCLLESGGLEPEVDTQSLYEGESIGVERMPLEATRLRGFGGTTQHWTGQCAPLDRSDFEPHSWIPHSGWPISRADLDPFYGPAGAVCGLSFRGFGDRERAFDEHGRGDGDRSVDEALWEALGHRPAPVDANRLDTRILQFSAPLRFGTAYREELRRASNVEVLLHATALRLHCSETNTRVIGVDVRTLGGKRGHIRPRRVVLCCGALENARLLLLSADQNAPAPGNEHDLVGRFLMDHLRSTPAEVAFEPSSDISRAYRTHRRQQAEGRSILALSLATRRSASLLGCGIHFFSAREESSEQKGSTGQMPMRRIMLVQEQAPNRDSRISLAQTRDALGQRRVQVDWRLGDLDRRTQEAAVLTIAAELGRLGEGRLRVREWFQDPAVDWTTHVADYNHPMGTTRMADDPTRGVVNRDCRFHSVDNLFAAGSSVFPTGGYLNPTLTIVALALRLAAHLKQSA